MSKKKKSFLVPVAALAASVAMNANANVDLDVKGSSANELIKIERSNVDFVLSNSASSKDNQQMAGHYSHRSHSSHSSHSSHRSHYSGY
ncbi:MAG: hypothetical protein MRY83_01970 [Flavobacteriales bacterium]|nr:hypothetical protein [Flavobacteriales bacterium]